MHHCQVSSATPKCQVFALRDSADRYHVARATSVVPQIGMELCGHSPTLGFHILVGVATGQVVRLIFERIDCGLHAALDQCVSNAGCRR